VEELGFPAVATTSSGISNSLGYADNEHISRRGSRRRCGCRSRPTWRLATRLRAKR
jgi:hypothetical protein